MVVTGTKMRRSEGGGEGKWKKAERGRDEKEGGSWGSGEERGGSVPRASFGTATSTGAAVVVAAVAVAVTVMVDGFIFRNFGICSVLGDGVVFEVDWRLKAGS